MTEPPEKPTRRSAPPLPLALAVGSVAAAMLLFEIVITRLFSVLFFYHFSFFAVSLVMSGLVIGGLVAARWNARKLAVVAFENRLSTLALVFGASTAIALFALVRMGPSVFDAPSTLIVALYAAVFLPGLAAAGAFLALAFARRDTWIGQLYAWDLLAAAAACLCSIAVLRILEGPPALLCPVVLAAAAAALLGRTRALRGGGVALVALSIAMGIGNAFAGGSWLRLGSGVGSGPEPPPLFERWNEHSRIVASDFFGAGRYLVIDRAAGTLMVKLPRGPTGAPPKADASWAKGGHYLAYRLGRPLRRAAIIGVGGGADLRPPLYWGATQVDGYELNRTFVDLLERDFKDYNAIASRPEVHLHHTEARVGIARSGVRYDVIQASLIDTWAATASGGFVLSENGLYTREGWVTFLRHLSDTGVLTMSRWHIPDAPAETHRLVALAASALEAAGFPDASRHLILLRTKQSQEAVAFTAQESRSTATILVSKLPFTAEEVRRLGVAGTEEGVSIAAAPGLPPDDDVLRQLLSPGTRAQAIASSRFNIAPPSDSKPYFFLQIRPTDWPNLSRDAFGAVTVITFNGVRVLMMLGAMALLLVLAVAFFTVFGMPGEAASPAERRAFRWMTLYFLGIGVGYVLVQLAFHQRLVILLGHPTLALSVVLFSMLLGTGAGAAFSGRLFPTGALSRATVIILGTLGATLLLVPFAGHLEEVSMPVRIALVGSVVMVVGFVLGFAFPLGVRRVAPTGEWAVQKMWAVNGAASIAGSVLAALVGLTMGSTATLASGMVAYGCAALGGMLGARATTAM